MKALTKALIFTFIFAILLIGELALNVKAQGGATLTLSPSNYIANQPDETFNLNITIKNVSNLYAWTMDVSWDPKILQLAGDPVEGDFLTQFGSTAFISYPNNTVGALNIGSALFVLQGASGSGALATLTFKITKPAAYSPINIVNASIYSPDPGPTTGSRKPMAHNEPQPSATVSLITGEGPLANAGDAQTVDEDTPMEFNASKTIPITNGTQFHWIFEDNGPKQLEGISPTYTFDIPGIHEVLLTVTDEQGFTSNTTVLITVNDVTPPVAVIIMQDVASGVSIKVGQTVTFDASGSYDPENGTVKPNGYTWNMGDESTLDQTEISHYAIHHQYEKTGVFNVSLTVTDERGNLTGSTTLQVTVGEEALAQTLNLPPTVIGILVILTVAVIVGSAFWLTGATLRKQSFEMRSKDEIEDRQNQ